MKTSILIVTVSGFAAAASGQSMYISAASLPGDDGAITLDVVLDATNYTGSFFAWHQYNFNIEITGDGPNQNFGAAVGGDLLESDFQATADTTGFGATAGPWVGGRRPGAFVGSASNNGGSRFGPQLADVVTDSVIGSSYGDGTIGGRQQASGAPEFNTLINTSRVYEVFRFTFAYTPDMGFGTISLTNVVANLYPSQGTDNVFVQDQMTISGISFPTPGVVPVLAAGGVVAGRRRRWD